MVKKVIGVVSLLIVGIGVFLALFHPSEGYQFSAANEKQQKTEKAAVSQPLASKTAKSDTKKQQAKSDLPKGISTKDWDLVLVNQDHAVTAAPTDLAQIGNYEVDSRITAPYNEMAQAAAAAQVNLVIVSGYRSISYQETLFQESVNAALAKGMTQAQAEKEALHLRTKPGHSEHNTGLAMDVVDDQWAAAHTDLDASFGQTKAGQWLKENAPKYGFVIRYPDGKNKITKVDYEPWHLRYVGKESALYMQQHSLCLEEYLDKVSKEAK
ncbi:M15 family metallopeptidase [Enterococcus hirae]|nr:M15 family metallopeptidase [Enterococcus hirae]